MLSNTKGMFDTQNSFLCKIPKDPNENKYKIKISGLGDNTLCEYIENCAQVALKPRVDDYTTKRVSEARKGRVHTSIDLKAFNVRQDSLNDR